jgi:hypothetical protein
MALFIFHLKAQVSQLDGGLEQCINVARFGFKGKAHGAEGKALENSDISDLPAFTLCAMRYALCRAPRNP